MTYNQGCDSTAQPMRAGGSDISQRAGSQGSWTTGLLHINSMGSVAALGFVGPMIYFIFIILSTLRLDFWLSTFTALPSASRAVTAHRYDVLRFKGAVGVNVVSENHWACARVPITYPLMASTLDHANQ